MAPPRALLARTANTLVAIGGASLNARLVTLGAAVAFGYYAARRTTTYSFRNRVVVITGGSRGLGLVLAREFAAEGAKLVLLARDAEELERAEEDLADSGAQVSHRGDLSGAAEGYRLFQEHPDRCTKIVLKP